MIPSLRRAVHSGSSWKIQDGGEQETTQGRRLNLILFTSHIKSNHIRRRDSGLNMKFNSPKMRFAGSLGLDRRWYERFSHSMTRLASRFQTWRRKSAGGGRGTIEQGFGVEFGETMSQSAVRVGLSVLTSPFVYWLRVNDCNIMYRILMRWVPLEWVWLIEIKLNTITLN